MAFLLSEDLVAVRKHRKLTVRDIYDSTRIPLEVIEEIESGYVFTPDCPRNKTYVRSFVRTYAKALKIPVADATHALDLVEKDAYDGFIRKNYLPNPDAAVQAEPVQEVPKPEPAPPRAGPRITAERASSMIDYKDEVSRPDPTRPHNQATPPPPDLKSINWVDMGNRFNAMSAGNRYLYIILAALAAIFVVGYASISIYQRLSEPGDSPSPTPVPVVAADSVAIPKDSVFTPALNVSAPDPAVLSLPDTLRILVFAYSEKLEGFRVRTETDGMIAQYWLEKGEAMEFEFVDAFYFKGQISRLELLFNGHRIPDIAQLKKNDGSVQLNRDYFEAHKEWLKAPETEDPLFVPRKRVPRPVFKRKTE